MSQMIKTTMTTILILVGSLSYGASPKYSFQSRFKSNSESVAYPGQTFRNLSIAELKSVMGQWRRGGYPGDEAEALYALWSYIDFDVKTDDSVMDAVGGNSELSIYPKAISGTSLDWKEGFTFADIAKNKQLLNKMAGNDKDYKLLYGKLLGWPTLKVEGINLKTLDVDGKKDAFVEPEDLVRALVMVTVKNTVSGKRFSVKNGSLSEQWIDQAYITENGVDTRQVLNKFLYAAVNLSQVAQDYLSFNLGSKKGLNADNTKPAKGTQPYTALEHHWDEAFGYFGAARDYDHYSDRDIRTGGSIDTNKDGVISIFSEKNWGVAVTSAKIDLASKKPKLSLNDDVFAAFHQGRQWIQGEAPQLKVKLKALKRLILEKWEKAIAGAAIHYVNAVLKEMNEYGTRDYQFVNHAKYWGELKGYALSFQFNPATKMSKSDFIFIHKLLGDQPVLMNSAPEKIDAYKKNLIRVRDWLQKSFQFSNENAKAL